MNDDPEGVEYIFPSSIMEERESWVCIWLQVRLYEQGRSLGIPSVTIIHCPTTSSFISENSSPSVSYTFGNMFL